MHFLLKIVMFQPAMLVSGRVVLSIVVSLLKRYHLRLLMSDPYGFANLPFVNPRPKQLSSPAPSTEPFLHGATNHHPLACPRKLPSLKLPHPTPGKGDSYWNISFLGAKMLVLGSVVYVGGGTLPPR